MKELSSTPTSLLEAIRLGICFTSPATSPDAQLYRLIDKFLQSKFEEAYKAHAHDETMVDSLRHLYGEITGKNTLLKNNPD